MGTRANEEIKGIVLLLNQLKNKKLSQRNNESLIYFSLRTNKSPVISFKLQFNLIETNCLEKHFICLAIDLSMTNCLFKKKALRKRNIAHNLSRHFFRFSPQDHFG